MSQKPKRSRSRASHNDFLDEPRGHLEQAAPDAPHWLLDDGQWIEMPENMRQLVSRILNPAYRRFVLDAPDELERSVGMTLVHLMWLELSAQVTLGKVIVDPQSPEAIMNNPDSLIDRHLRLTTAKCQTAELLLKLQMVQGMLKHPSFCPGANLPPLEAQDSDAPSPHGPRSFLPSSFTQTTREA